MRRCYGLLLLAACAGGGCQSSPQGLDPFLGPQRIAPPPTGSAVPNGAAPYYPPGGTAPLYPSSGPTVTPGVPATGIAPTNPSVPSGGTYNYNPSSARSDGAASPTRALVPQPTPSASTSPASAIALPGKAATWSGGGTSGGEAVKIVEPPASVQQASFSSPAVKSAPASAPIEAGPLVDISSLPNAKR